jgi:uncharacterized protein YkwD
MMTKKIFRRVFFIKEIYKLLVLNIDKKHSLSVLIIFQVLAATSSYEQTIDQQHQALINTSFDILFNQYGKLKAINLIRQHFLIEVNHERAKLKNKPLRFNDILNSTSQEHSEDMAKRSYFSHVNPDSLSSYDRMSAHHYNLQRAAENISYNHKNIKSIINGYLTSTQGHRDIFTVGEYEEVGFGIAAEVYKTSMGRKNIYYATTDYGIQFKTNKK